MIDGFGAFKDRLELLQLTDILAVDLALIGMLLEEVGQVFASSGQEVIDPREGNDPA